MLSVLNYKGTLIACLFLCMPTVSLAQSLTVSASSVYTDYREYSERKTVLNNETGWLPSLSLAYGFSTSLKNEFSLAMQLTKGSLNYAGYLQNGSPHQTQTDTVIYDVAMQYFHRLENHSDFAVGLLIGQHNWQRDILPSGAGLGLYEQYKWYRVLASVQYQYNKMQYQFSAGALLDGNVNVNLTELNLGKIDIPLKRGYEINANLTHLIHQTEHSEGFISWDGSLIYFDKSQPIRAGNSQFTEPNSIHLQTAIIFSYRFKL